MKLKLKRNKKTYKTNKETKITGNDQTKTIMIPSHPKPVFRMIFAIKKNQIYLFLTQTFVKKAQIIYFTK